MLSSIGFASLYPEKNKWMQSHTKLSCSTCLNRGDCCIATKGWPGLRCVLALDGRDHAVNVVDDWRGRVQLICLVDLLHRGLQVTAHRCRSGGTKQP